MRVLRAGGLTLCLALVAGCADTPETPLSPAAVDVPVFIHGEGADPAGTSNYRTHLKGRNEVPSNTSRAQGQAIFKLAPDGDALHYKLIVANIHDVTQAHIHLAPAGANGPVVAFLSGFELIPGRFSGVLATGTITASDVVGPLAGSMEALASAIEAGNAYVNVHTAGRPPSEVRGQIR